MGGKHDRHLGPKYGEAWSPPQVPMHVQCYLDNILIQSSSCLRAKEDLQVTIRVLQDHGFSINFHKSHLTPTNPLLHLGAVIDTILCEVSLSQECQTSLKTLVSWIQMERTELLALLSQLLGSLSSVAAGNNVRMHGWHTEPGYMQSSAQDERMVLFYCNTFC